MNLKYYEIIKIEKKKKYNNKNKHNEHNKIYRSDHLLFSN